MKKTVGNYRAPGGSNTHRNQVFPTSSLVEIPEQQTYNNKEEENKFNTAQRGGSAMNIIMNNTSGLGH